MRTRSRWVREVEVSDWLVLSGFRSRSTSDSQYPSPSCLQISPDRRRSTLAVQLQLRVEASAWFNSAGSLSSLELGGQDSFRVCSGISAVVMVGLISTRRKKNPHNSWSTGMGGAMMKWIVALGLDRAVASFLTSEELSDSPHMIKENPRST